MAASLLPPASVTSGDKAPLVILHGFLGAASQFDTLSQHLEAHLPVWRIQLPGHGDTPWLPDQDSLESIALWVHDQLDGQVDTPFHLLGHSMGGYIAAAFAAKFPEALKSLTLLHSTALPDQPERIWDRNRAVEFVRDYGNAPYVRTFVQHLFHEPREEWLAEARALAMQVPAEALIAYLEMMRDRPNRHPALQALQVPVHYLAGSEDGLVAPLQNQKEVALLQEGQLHEFEGIGHMSMYEAPDALLAQLQSYFS